MKKTYFILMLTGFLFLNACNTKKKQETVNDSSTIESSYFGQKPPGLTPEVFAPGTVSINGRFEGAISFSPDLEEMYFGAKDEDEETHIYFSKLEEEKWTPIKRIDFTNGEKDGEMHPFVSPDRERIYFTAFNSGFLDTRIWYVDRSENSWSDAVQLDLPIDDDKVFFPNQAKNGDLYYFNLSKGKTYYAPNNNDTFPQEQEVNLEFGDHVFIAPSQDYLVYTGRNNVNESRDLYVCFKDQKGTWTKPINLGNAINSNFNEKSPSITPDGKYLFFGRDERDIEPGLANIYWVSTEVIYKLRPVK